MVRLGSQFPLHLSDIMSVFFTDVSVSCSQSTAPDRPASTWRRRRRSKFSLWRERRGQWQIVQRRIKKFCSVWKRCSGRLNPELSQMFCVLVCRPELFSEVFSLFVVAGHYAGVDDDDEDVMLDCFYMSACHQTGSSRRVHWPRGHASQRFQPGFLRWVQGETNMWTFLTENPSWDFLVSTRWDKQVDLFDREPILRFPGLYKVRQKCGPAW